MSGPGSGIDGPTAGRRRATLAELRAKLSADRLTTPFPVLPALAELFPGCGLRKGAAYTVESSASLALAMLAGPSRAGSWCGVVGLPELGLEAADGFGVELGRLALVPSPERRWWETVATLLDVLDVVLVRPPAASASEVAAPDARRLAARLRERGSTLIVADSAAATATATATGTARSARTAGWPGGELRFTVTASRWEGLGAGHGHLAARQVTVEASGRGSAGRTRTARLWLPDRTGQLAAVQEHPIPERSGQERFDQERSDAPGEVIELATARTGLAPARRAG